MSLFRTSCHARFRVVLTILNYRQVSERDAPLLVMVDTLIKELEEILSEVHSPRFVSPIVDHETEIYISQRLPNFYSQRRDLAISHGL